MSWLQQLILVVLIPLCVSISANFLTPKAGRFSTKLWAAISLISLRLKNWVKQRVEADKLRVDFISQAESRIIVEYADGITKLCYAIFHFLALLSLELITASSLIVKIFEKPNLAPHWWDLNFGYDDPILLAVLGLSLLVSIVGFIYLTRSEMSIATATRALKKLRKREAEMEMLSTEPPTS